MEIIKINPQGFCKGVINAIYQLNKKLDSNDYKKPLYMLGGIVHNKHIINAYTNKGIKIIKFEDIENITEGTIIITAHGLSTKKKNIIKNKNLDIIDTTCMEVKKIQNIIFDKINEGYEIIYFGEHNHPECKAILEDHTNINLIEKKDDILNLDIKSDKILFASQTTSSYEDVLNVEKILEFKYPNILKISDICNATKLRQLALMDKAKECDLILIIGDKMSNNTNKLRQIASFYTEAILIENAEEIEEINFSRFNKIGITAGASTPNILVDEIIKKIENPQYQVNLKNDDYIKY